MNIVLTNYKVNPMGLIFQLIITHQIVIIFMIPIVWVFLKILTQVKVKRILLVLTTILRIIIIIIIIKIILIITN
jgi:hypothetical protein